MDIIETASTEAGEAADKLVRVPAGVMDLLRQSYGSRERVLDWMLAIGVTVTMAYVFRDELMGLITPPDDANAGRVDSFQPNQNVPGAFPRGQKAPANPYTYNMPPSRSVRYSVDTSGMMPPGNPAQTPFYP
jgi:hypothetical protein